MSNNSTSNDDKDLNATTSNNPRIIEIPVQHYTSPVVSTNDSNNQPDLNFFNERPRLFDDFQSSFDSSPFRQRSLFNREPFNTRFDDFFSRPSLIHQQSLPQQKQQSLFDDPFLNRSTQSPSRDRSNSTTQQPTLASLANVNSGRQSPIVRTESPKSAYTNPSGASVYQIPIQHIQTPVTTINSSSEIPNNQGNSDFKHQIPLNKPIIKGTDTPPTRQTTPPTFKQPAANLVDSTPPVTTTNQQNQPKNQPSQPVPQQQPFQSTPRPSSVVQQPLQQQQPKPQPQIQQQQPIATSSNTKPQSHTSTAFINLDSDFKQPVNTNSTKFRAESPARQLTSNPTPNPAPVPATTSTAKIEIKPVNKQSPSPPQTTTTESDFKQPLNKIRSESPARQQSQPTVIPLPPPSSSVKQEPQPNNTTTNTTTTAPLPNIVPVSEQQNMGNSQNKNKTNNNTDTTNGANNNQSSFYVPTPPQTAPKTEQDKCDEIACELENLHQAVNNFDGNNKRDKNYLKLDELLTRCLLKLDNIDRSDERVHQLRKRLINFTHEIINKLETKVSPPTTAVVENAQPILNQNESKTNATSSNDDIKETNSNEKLSPDTTNSLDTTNVETTKSESATTEKPNAVLNESKSVKETETAREVAKPILTSVLINPPLASPVVSSSETQIN